ncbi:MAG: heavy metal-binding domain-containing protein, partial [Solirubrobacteraceae bacterium]
MDHGNHHRDPQGEPAAPPPEVAKVKDPVCGMSVTPGKARGGSATHEGHEYWFCNPKCREKFIADPARYLAAQQATSPSPAPLSSAPSSSAPSSSSVGAAEYTCPMHPEVVRSTPGDCPECGMALEPRTVALDDDNPELRDMTRRLIVAAVLSVPLVALSMLEMLGVPMTLLSTRPLTWVQLVLATPVVLWAGWPFFVRGARSIAARKLNMFT